VNFDLIGQFSVCHISTMKTILVNFIGQIQYNRS